MFNNNSNKNSDNNHKKNSNSEGNKSEKNEKKILFLIIIFILVCGGILIYSKFKPDISNNNSKDLITIKDSINIDNDFDSLHKNELINSDSLLLENSEKDSLEAIRLSDEPISYLVDNDAGKSKSSVFTGKRINISVTGLDGRIGRVSHLADANHVLSILIETGEIEITSIPRDTYCDLGYEDSTGLNKLTICRAQKGRKRYHEEVARIARLDKIHYFVEFGFSQAMGIIEFLGYKEPSKTLQVLRNRKGLGGDDYQRCYTQGQFIRQAILGHFNKFTGVFGGVLARAGLLMVETNLSGEKAIEIIEKLEKLGFPKSPESVTVRVRPPIQISYKIYDFGDEETVNKLIKKIENFNKPRFEKEIESPQPTVNVQAKLNDVLKSAAADTAKNPQRTISKLSSYFEQRSWYQVKDKAEREKIRNEFGKLLSTAYTKRKKNDEAAKVLEIIEAEKKIFN